MTRNFIPMAGIFIACALFAAIPAVSAADTPLHQQAGPVTASQQIATPSATPAPLNTLGADPTDPVRAIDPANNTPQVHEVQKDVLAGQGVQDQQTLPPANATPEQNPDLKTVQEKVTPAPTVATLNSTQLSAPAPSLSPVPSDPAQGSSVQQQDTGSRQQGTTHNQQGNTSRKVAPEKVPAPKSP